MAQTLKLWLLRPLDEVLDKMGPWEPWFDKSFGFVVAAEDQQSARLLASQNSGDEGGQAWLNDLTSSCEELTPGDTPRIIMRDFASA